MVAAATTALPERADRGRDWDYRYVWICDQAYAGQAAGKPKGRPRAHGKRENLGQSSAPAGAEPLAKRRVVLDRRARHALNAARREPPYRFVDPRPLCVRHVARGRVVRHVLVTEYRVANHASQSTSEPAPAGAPLVHQLMADHGREYEARPHAGPCTDPGAWAPERTAVDQPQGECQAGGKRQRVRDW